MLETRKMAVVDFERILELVAGDLSSIERKLMGLVDWDLGCKVGFKLGYYKTSDYAPKRPSEGAAVVLVAGTPNPCNVVDAAGADDVATAPKLSPPVDGVAEKLKETGAPANVVIAPVPAAGARPLKPKFGCTVAVA